MLESMQESLPIDVLVGKKNVEVRPAHTNKGEIVRRLMYTYPDTEFCMCAGDDKTDEDMVRFFLLSPFLPSLLTFPSRFLSVPLDGPCLLRLHSRRRLDRQDSHPPSRLVHPLPLPRRRRQARRRTSRLPSPPREPQRAG
jgi:hypothetical protein